MDRETAMTTPRVTEDLLPLEPTSRDPFVDDLPAAAPELRELDHRRNDGIDVRLLWNPIDDSVLITVSDAKTGTSFSMEVEPAEALDAFHHPYAHAAARSLT
jgi:hypothetical protein